jgi:hypothetical protein
MGEVIDIGDYRLLAAQRAVARLIAEIKVAPEAYEGTGHRALALATLEVAALAIEAMGDEDCWPLQEAAVIIGEALADLADSGPEDGSNTIWVPAKALARAGSVEDYSHPDPDFGLVADAISEVVQRSTGEEDGRNGPWTAPTFWQTNAHDQSQADVILKVAPIVAEVAADLALGRPMTRNPLDAIRAVI